MVSEAWLPLQKCSCCAYRFAAQVEQSKESQVTLTPAPALPPKEEQASKRAELLERLAALPEHLRLGVTLPGMRELLSQLPSDAVEQVNANIPLDTKTNKPKFPENDTANGYVNQYFVTLAAKGKEGQPGDGLAVC